MYTKTSYYITYGDNKNAWLSPNKSLDDFENVTYKEERILLFAEDGLQLKNKNTGELTNGIWLKDTAVDDYEEVEVEDDDRHEIKRVDNQ